MTNYKLILQYDGSGYVGWQRQSNPKLPTIQGKVETALAKVFQHDIKVEASGRTDAGVHAQGQVVTCQGNKPIPVVGLQKAVNSLLPADIAVVAVEQVPADFHPRYLAKEKWYRYTIYHNSIPNVFWRNYSFHVPYALERENMATASQFFLGTHNFQGFCSTGTGVKSFQRTVSQCQVSWQGDFIYIDMTASGFLYNMVRIVTGTLLECGRGKLKVAEMPDIISSGVRRAAGPTAPPQGLCLMQVMY